VFRPGFNQNVNASLIFLDDGKRATGGLQQCREFSFNEPALLLWIAYVAQWRTHVQLSANLTLEEHIVAAQVDLGGLSGCAQLFQMAVAEFAFFVPLVADGLRVCDPLRYRRRRSGWFVCILVRNVCGHDPRFICDSERFGRAINESYRDWERRVNQETGCPTNFSLSFVLGGLLSDGRNVSVDERKRQK